MEGSSNFEGEIDWANVKIPKYAGVDVRYSINKDSVTDLLNKSWEDRKEFSDFQVKIYNKPFMCCEIEEFLFDDDFPEDLAKNFEEIELYEKATDLYQLKQSDDLSNIDDPEAQTLMTCLKGQCRKWIEDVTGLKLSDKVHATFSSYSKGDYLLCHDDRCEDRKIAFILYCNKRWQDDCGGILQMYDTDEHGQPGKIARGIVPAYNKFVFFEVSEKSFHRVSEVRTSLQNRISVNGWFHSENVAAPSPVNFGADENLPLVDCKLEEMSMKMVLSLYHPRYLTNQSKRDIKQHFRKEREILLPGFLRDRVLTAVTYELTTAVDWEHQGPPNRRSYNVLKNEEKLYVGCTKLAQAMTSKSMCELLSKLTGLRLLSKEQETAKFNFDIRQWEMESYSILSDADEVPNDNCLDVILFILAENHESQLNGGSFVYIDRDSGRQVLSIPPSHNGLALVYRDRQTRRFTQYYSYDDFTSKYFTFMGTFATW